MTIDVNQFNKNGYLIIKNVFTAEEIKTLRAAAYDQLERDKKKGLVYELPQYNIKAKFSNGDLLSKELLSKVLLDDRILNIARTVLGQNDLIYFGDSSYQIGTGSNGFHRDNIDRSDLNGPDWQGKYTLVRMGIYLQDHKNYSGGLKVRTGSHRKNSGPATFIDSEVGDVVIWDLKTIHSGNAVRLKFAPATSINIALIERIVPTFLRKEEEQERISMFMTFALKSPHLDRYLTEYTLKRKDTIDHAKASKYTAETLEKARQKQLQVLQPLNN
jgi:ectoine hydroxylase-related dioxygenase (phytanoyl-CoA dioxygenase family)